jgi:UDP-glucose 4-epimerase
MLSGHTPIRAVVTGGAGFIGSHLTDGLLGRGYEVDVIDDLSTGRITRLPPGAKMHKVNITDSEMLNTVISQARPVTIFHLAAKIDVRASVAAPPDDAAVNVMGTINVLEAAHTVGARVIFAGTGGALYGNDIPIPSAEDVLPKPESPYGTSKYCAEQYIGMYNRLYGTRHTVLRLGNVYGPGQDPAGEAGVIATVCGEILAGRQPVIYGDGTQTRDYIFVSDVIDAFLSAADLDYGGVWNIGTGSETSLLDLFSLIGLVGRKDLNACFAPPRQGELQRSALDARRAAKELGWKATVPLADGIREVYRWIVTGRPDRAGH